MQGRNDYFTLNDEKNQSKTYFYIGTTGKAWLTENWKLCKPLQEDDDVMELKYWASDVYVALAMVNYPYEANFLAHLPANPIKV